MAKVRLLNDGTYEGDEGVSFPVIVEGAEYRHGKTGYLLGFHIEGFELVRVGFTGLNLRYSYYFSIVAGDCELIEAVNE